MKIALFGATGSTGTLILQRALSESINVTALVRNPAKLGDLAAQTKVVVGDVQDARLVAEVVQGQDAVLIALGAGTDLSATTQLSTRTQTIVDAMIAGGVARVVCLLSGWIFYEESTIPPQFIDITREHHRQLEALQKTPLEWIAVCPPALTDGPDVPHFQLSVGKMPKRGYMEISKRTVARLMLELAQGTAYIHQSLGIAN